MCTSILVLLLLFALMLMLPPLSVCFSLAHLACILPLALLAWNDRKIDLLHGYIFIAVPVVSLNIFAFVFYDHFFALALYCFGVFVG